MNGICLALVFAFLLAGFGPSGALAGTQERDKAWDALVAEAVSHGASETKLDRSSSYVFQRPDGSYLSLTWLSPPKTARSVCLIAKDENATACVDWDNGKVTLGDRADPATPWRFHAYSSLDALEADRPGLLDQLFAGLDRLVGLSRRYRQRSPWRFDQSH